MSTVTNMTQLNAAIVAADGVTAPGTVVTITLGNDISLGGSALKAINLHDGVTLVIEGGGHILSGGGTQRGFFVYAGTVEINDLAINNMLAKGGNGGLNGGGGAGLGGGLFVGADVAGNPGNVTLTNVTFANNKAVGGAGGSVSPEFFIDQGGSGGGGLGGNGGDGATDGALGGSQPAGGGGGIGGNGGAGHSGLPTDGAAGIVPGAAGGGGAFGYDDVLAGTNSHGGTNGGGGGGGGGLPDGTDYGGGGGGVGGTATTSAAGGAGGFGGGGGGGGLGSHSNDAGDGGYGGGGGGGGIYYGIAGAINGGIGGDGGFGGGGGGGGDSLNGGTGGFGGGDGYGEHGAAFTFAGGGGGLGAGGNIFVQEGATLNIAGAGSIAAGTVTGGASLWQAGQAFGNGIYLQGNNTLTFSPTGTQTIAGVIGDDGGSAFANGYHAPAGYTQGGVGVTVNGTGTLVLAGNNTYAGATTVAEGRLLVDGQIYSAVTVESGGTLGGTGRIGFFFTPSEVESGGKLAPGDDGAGVFSSGSRMDFLSGATFAVQLGGAAAGQFDQLVVLSGFSLDDGAILDLSLINGYVPTVGSSFRIIDDRSAPGDSGTFAGHAEGSTFISGGVKYSITYQGGDGNDVVLTTLSTNASPVAAADTGSVTEDTTPNPITGNVLTNDSDPDGNALSVTSSGTFNLAHGSLVIHADGSYAYTLDNSNPAVDALNTGQTLVDHFTYGISDGHGGTNSASLDITIHGKTNSIPPDVTGAVTLAAIAEDSGARLITQAELLANVTDVDGPSLTATGLAIATGTGTLVDNHDGTWSYTPGLNDDTQVRFSYSVTDGSTSLADSATLDITPVNDAPFVTGAVTLAAIAEGSGARLITQAQLLGNVTDPDGPQLTATGLAIATGAGALVDNHDGTWSYTPALNDDSSVSFAYQVSDGTTSVADSATLDMTPVNDAPVVAGSVTLAAIAEDSGARLITQAQLLGNATDVDGPSLTAAQLAIATGGGTLVDNHDGTWSYTPALNDDHSVSFSYSVTDGTLSVADSATLDITPVNDAPVVAGAVTFAAIAEDSGAQLITQAQLLGNVTDVDGPSLTAVGFAIASGSGALVDNHNGTWSYAPGLNDDSSVAFSWRVTDGTTSVADTGTLDITPFNDAPVNTMPASQSIVPNSNVAITGLAVADVDSTALTTTLHVEHGALIVGAVGGGATVAGSGSSTVKLTGSAAQIDAVLGTASNVLYHSTFDFSGTDHLTMTSNDGALSDIDVLNLSVFQQVQAQTFGDITRPTITLDATGHIILDQPAIEFASAYGMKGLYLGLPSSTPFPPVHVPDFHV
ncbi:cadherin-like domain-containing protein [Bradyrhizobium sp. 197]|uniref:cadherin-like domain-containing protein n=1 Tax=Bradyrhizobium sp. 197 TaxID=2782663 RepID=UPI00211123C5|nr:cadherin-like domain-containing protein [Bradyrhizobium sp. 197]MCK1474976.1 cadherin-like domain-containing protein [Bradyrhizobium sp. 197]